MKPLVSIVMPVYNSGKYIRDTISSILNQKYKNIELICVDDGSSDNSVEIIEHYKKDDNRIQLIRQKNLYAGVARNNGLEKANGKYIMFLDSDDIFNKNMIRDLVKIAEKKNTDIIFFGYYTFSNSISKKRPAKIKYTTKNPISPKDINDKIFQYSFGVPWNKFFNLEFIKNTNIKFQNLKNNNDEYFSKMTVLKASSILYLSKRYVYYRTSNASSLQGKLNSDPTNFSKALCAMYDYMEKNKMKELYCQSYYNFALNISIEALNKCNNIDNFRKVFDATTELFKHITFNKELIYADNINYQLITPILNSDIKKICFEMLQLDKKNMISKNSIEYRIGNTILKIFRFK